MTIREAANRLRVTTPYVYVLLYNRKLEGRKVGKRWLIEPASVDQRIERFKDRFRARYD